MPFTHVAEAMTIRPVRMSTAITDHVARADAGTRPNNRMERRSLRMNSMIRRVGAAREGGWESESERALVRAGAGAGAEGRRGSEVILLSHPAPVGNSGNRWGWSPLRGGQ